MERLRARQLPGLTIDVLIERLSRHPAVRSVAFIGSAATGRNPSSDYDLLIILEQEPLVLRSAAAIVGGVLADFVFTTPGEVRVLQNVPDRSLASETWPERIQHWLASAQPVYDPDGLLASAREAHRGRTDNFAADAFDVRRRWDRANYNVIHNRRYAASTDPLYRDAFALRMTYSLADLMTDYFAARGIPWRGEKVALEQWGTHDSEFKTLFFACLSEPNPARRIDQYAELVRLAFEPVGDPWPDDAHSPGPATPTDLEPATAIWNELIEGLMST
jgi:predicted nucleotidyltransferase